MERERDFGQFADSDFSKVAHTHTLSTEPTNDAVRVDIHLGIHPIIIINHLCTLPHTHHNFIFSFTLS